MAEEPYFEIVVRIPLSDGGKGATGPRKLQTGGWRGRAGWANSRKVIWKGRREAQAEAEGDGRVHDAFIAL